MQDGPDDSDDDGSGRAAGERTAGLALTIRPASVDEMSMVRYIHDNAFKRDGLAFFGDDEIQGFTRHVYAPGYAERLLADNLHVATMGADLVGTAAWVGVTDGRSTARIKHVFVRPLFTGLGIGHRLMDTMEQFAIRAGYDELTLRAPINAIGFFEARGYAITAYGVRALSGDTTLPVAFMRRSGSVAGIH